MREVAAGAELAEARRSLAEAGRRLVTDRLVVGTAGNLSVRVSELVAVTPSGVPYADIGPADIVVVRTDDGAVVDGGRSPTSELPLHLAVYRTFPGVGAVVHTHSPWATAASTVLRELPAVHYAVVALGGPVPVVPYHRFGSPELADAVVAGLADRSGVLMANHGATCVGATLAEAYDRALTLEWLCEVAGRARQFGGVPALLTDAQLTEVRAAAAAAGYRLYGTGP